MSSLRCKACNNILTEDEIENEICAICCERGLCTYEDLTREIVKLEKEFRKRNKEIENEKNKT